MIDLSKIKKIFILGIKGVAMTNLAIILKKSGKEVFGWDVKEEFITEPLIKKYNFPVYYDPQDPNLLKQISQSHLMIYSAAHQGKNHPLIKKFQNSVPLAHQAEILGLIMKQFKIPVAVCGSHGKTTTAALLSFALIQLGKQPSYLVGTSEFNCYDGGDFVPPDLTDYFVAEADEYGLNPPFDKTPKFYFFSPQYIIATNIDFDHPDVYANLEEVKEAFKTFFDKRKIIACGDNPPLVSVLNKLKKENIFTYGLNSSNDYQIVSSSLDKDYNYITLKLPDGKISHFKIKIFGEMNVLNATAVIAFFHQMKIPLKEIASAMENFSGAKRRFEKIYQDKKITIFDDYGHHPQEIEATLKTARLRFPHQRIIVIFQPHTYSRTAALLREFNQVLSQADSCFILPIFPSARENPKDFKITSLDLVRINNNKKNLFFVETKDQLFKNLKKRIKKGDIIFTIGAGDVYKLGYEIPKKL